MAFIVGADLSWVPEDEAGGATFVDTDGATKDILALLSNHGFNFVRLRTFVDPTASDGYSTAGHCGLAETVAMARRVKKAGMGLVVDLHYSDSWADPAKQCIPVAWQGYTADQLAQAVYDYTRSVLTALTAAGAGPDIVQVGNEIAPGMLIHVCDAKGTPTRTAAVNGSSSTFADLARFLKPGLQAVRDTAPGAKTMVHLDRGGDLSTSTWWLDAAQSSGVTFDVFAESTYVAYQGQPSGWKAVFEALAARYPKLELAIAEYNNEAVTTPAGTTSIQQANQIIRTLPNGAGIGTFFWEPTRSGAWGNGLFTTSGNVRTAIPGAMAIYDAMRLGIDVPAGYHLAWSDEFDVDGAPASASWSYERGFVRNQDGRSPFRQPHSMLLNLAIGGDNGGDPSSTAFPQRYEIDYVRVFQRD